MRVHLFARTLRTGRRALSLERGSLLDTILRLGDTGKESMWESTVKQLRALDPPIGDIPQFQTQIKDRMVRLVGLSADKDATGFYASDLTQTLFLADTEQRIFEGTFRPGVRADRLDILKDAIDLGEVDLRDDNYRSADSDILAVAGDGPTHHLLQHRPDTGRTYRGFLKFRQHVSLSCFQGGQQARWPLRRELGCGAKPTEMPAHRDAGFFRANGA